MGFPSTRRGALPLYQPPWPGIGGSDLRLTAIAVLSASESLAVPSTTSDMGGGRIRQRVSCQASEG